MKGKIYIIRNDINSKIYIGQTVQTLQKRFNGHSSRHRNSRSESMAIKKAIFKYGKEHFRIELIEEVEREILDEREMYWISYYKSNQREFGYNLTEGGGNNRETMTTPLEDILDIEEFKKYIIDNYPSVKEVEKNFIFAVRQFII